MQTRKPRWSGLSRSRLPAIFFLIGFLGAIQPRLPAENAVTVEGPYTVFRTGTNAVLNSFSLDLAAPDGFSRLEFAFGFATDEPDLAGTFFDSFSVTLQNEAQSATALVLTADRTGVQWAPTNSGGVDPGQISAAQTNFPGLSPSLNLQFAFTVAILLPEILTGGMLKIFFDFFDNRNSFSSLAFFSGVELSAGTTPATAVAVESAASVGGPFAVESGAILDAAGGRISIPRLGASRFFRIKSDFPTRLDPVLLENGSFHLHYTFQPHLLELQSAATQAGPFATESATIFDLAAQTASLPDPGAARIYRLISDGAARITNARTVGGQRVLDFAFDPTLFVLQSSASLLGPFADEAGVSNDPLARVMSWKQLSASRFFRLASDRALRITRTDFGTNAILFHFQ